MKLIIEPSQALSVLSADLDLVIAYKEPGIAEVFTPPGLPSPDRHLLLGTVQCVAFAIQEMDPECMAVVEGCRVMLDRDDTVKSLDSELVVVRSLDGRLGVLVIGTSDDARRLARAAVRAFTLAVRLDVP